MDEKTFNSTALGVGAILSATRFLFYLFHRRNLSKTTSRFQPYHMSQSQEQPSPPSRSRSASGAGTYHRRLGSESRLLFPTNPSRGGESTCEASPVSPATPHSAHPFRDADIEVASSSFRDHRLPISDRGSLLLSTTPEYHSLDWSSESRSSSYKSVDNDPDFTSHPYRPW